MKTAVTLLSALSFLIAPASRAEDLSKISEINGPDAFVSQPRINFPYEAKRSRITGAGVAVIEIDPATGKVRNVRMGKSTGYALLDQEVIRAFRTAVFKKGSSRRCKIPVSFSLSAKPGKF